MNDYQNADKYFLKYMEVEPWKLEGLEVYSTVLWHQKKEKELTSLVNHMNDINPNSAYTLIAKGNSFSFQKEHKIALKNFQSATKMNPTIAYPFTLCGHEHFANDDLEESLLSFRSAVRVDERHYNAWFGIGKVYYRQQKYDLAIEHFKKALKINPRSSVLYSYLAMVCVSPLLIFRP
jgi:anaphase-promoting complex subunit 3